VIWSVVNPKSVWIRSCKYLGAGAGQVLARVLAVVEDIVVPTEGQQCGLNVVVCLRVGRLGC
jgi:hypothetical protein